MKEFPQIFAFYSFKGGVGRSMAVLNLAYALAAKGRHVLVLDMDLEAPGLSGFLHDEGEITRFAPFDMVDLVGWASKASPPLDPLSFPPLSDYAVSIRPEKLEAMPRVFSELGRLDIIPVDVERDYYNRLPRLSMGSLDQDALVRIGSVLRAWLKSLRFPIEVPDYYGPDFDRTASYDYVLVDSRTGITEIGGLCIGPLSDQLVVISALNNQNVEGTRKFLKVVGVKNGTPVEDEPKRKPCLIVASLVPTGEIETKRVRLEKLEEALGKVQVKLSYHPQLALKETIFTRDYPDEYLATEYNELLKQILDMASDGDDPYLTQAIFNESRSKAELRAALHWLARSTSVVSPGSLFFLLSKRNPAEVLDEADYALLDRACRVLSSAESPFRWNIVNSWGTLLAQWGSGSTDPALGRLRLEAAMRCYEEVLQDKDSSQPLQIWALFGRIMIHRQRGETDKAIADYAAIIHMPDVPAEQTARALFGRGTMYVEQGDNERAFKDFTAVIQMTDAPAKQKAESLLVRGWQHFAAGRYNEAVADHRQASSIDPSDARAVRALAIALLVHGQPEDAMAIYDAALVLADLKILDEMSKDLREAIAKHSQLPGAEEVMARLEARREALRQRHASNDGAIVQEPGGSE